MTEHCQISSAILLFYVEALNLLTFKKKKKKDSGIFILFFNFIFIFVCVWLGVSGRLVD